MGYSYTTKTTTEKRMSTKDKLLSRLKQIGQCYTVLLDMRGNINKDKLKDLEYLLVKVNKHITKLKETL